MNTQITCELPADAIDDALAFRDKVGKFISGETPPEDFRKMRVPMGIYEQREDGIYMVRVRAAAGLFLPHQAKLIADLSETYGNGIVHVTTRQDFQIHGVTAEDLPTILEKLLEVGLSTRGGGGDTVRNISACSRAGACCDEVFDVTPYTLALSDYLSRDPANLKLPRKFKVAFSGCGSDCALGSVADVGFFAHVQDTERGFSVYAGGGLGARSALAILLEKFVPADAIFHVAEAIKRVFEKHGDRTNRSKARLRFVVERLGDDGFREEYLEELNQIRLEEVPCRPLPAVDGDSRESVIHLRLFLGDIPAEQLRVLADIVSRCNGHAIRTTQTQNLQLRGIPEAEIETAYQALRVVNESLLNTGHTQCVACVGAATCRLGTCLSGGLATAIEEELHDLALPFEAVVRISGCPNSCGQHPVAPIGLYGGVTRIDGKTVPSYTIVAGGCLAEGDSALATPVAKVPARAIPALLREFFTAAKENWQPDESLGTLMKRWGTAYLAELAPGYVHIPSFDEAPEYYRDFV